LGLKKRAASERSDTAKLTLTASESSRPVCETALWILPPSVPTLDAWTELLGLAASTSSAAGSRARTSASPGAGLESKGSEAAYGLKSLDWFARFDPATSSWRTSQLSLEGGLSEFSETWPRAGMTRSGMSFQLVPLAPTISESASGYWPTPRANKVGGYSSDGFSPTLEQAVRRWTTPCADDTGYRRRKYSQGGTALSTQAGGLLNPPWVEWLMGFPAGWTDLKPLGTPSSPRLSSGSAAG
jgi:hypothetical protein